MACLGAYLRPVTCFFLLLPFQKFVEAFKPGPSPFRVVMVILEDGGTLLDFQDDHDHAKRMRAELESLGELMERVGREAIRNRSKTSTEACDRLFSVDCFRL